MPERKEIKSIKIGDTVPILQHNCEKGSLGLEGEVIEINQNGVPVLASCLKCKKTVTVDIKTLIKK